MCTHDVQLYTHIDMCLGKYLGHAAETRYIGIGEQVVEFCQNSGFDALFADIRLPEIPCLDLARRCREIDTDFVLLLLIDKPEEAMCGYEQKAFRCLLKGGLYEELEGHMDALKLELGINRNLVEFHCSDRIFSVFTDEILYAEVQHHSVIIYYRGKHRPPSHLSNSLATVEDILEPSGFCRISRSFIVNMDYIENVAYEWVTMINGQELPLSRPLYHEFKAMHEAHKKKKMSNTGIAAIHS